MRLAHQMALYSSHVTADGVDSMEFQELANRHRVMGVPKTVINDGAKYVEGAVPEEMLVDAIKAAL